MSPAPGDRPSDARSDDTHSSAPRAADGRSPFPAVADGPAPGETCDYCGAETLVWRKCKQICMSCSQINKSCADL